MDIDVDRVMREAWFTPTADAHQLVDMRVQARAYCWTGESSADPPIDRVPDPACTECFGDVHSVNDPGRRADKMYGKLPYSSEKESTVMPAATATVSATARLEARISTDLHALLKRAAELQGRTMTDFVVAAVQDAAQRAIEQSDVVRLSLADQECFAQALLSPPQPAPALERAFARRRALLRAV